METFNLTEFKHQIELNVRFMDLDLMQHVNNSRYLNFLEEARIDYAQKIMGTYQDISSLSMVVARIEIDYFKPILFGERIVIYNRVTRLGTKSFTFESILESIGREKKIAARAIQVLVAIDVKTGKSSPLPDFLKKKVKVFENI